VKSLEQVMFQRDLGSYLDKTQRLQAICSKLSDSQDLQDAARFCKADLTAEMVFEMSELQGVMGGLYARAEGHGEGVWKPIYEHYKPESMDDSLPSTLGGAWLSIVDKLDTIVGCFGLGIIPSGSRDPFSLRRQAQGIIRILLQFELAVSLDDLVERVVEEFPSLESPGSVRAEVRDFLSRRVLFIFRERGIPYDVLNALSAVGIGRVDLDYEKAVALNAIKSEDDFEALAVAFKRVKNILSNQDFEAGLCQADLLVDNAEKELYEAFSEVERKVLTDLSAADFGSALKTIATLRGPVDDFFDEVLVLTDQAELRLNRLRLLQSITGLFLRVADISEIIGTPSDAKTE
jgi:glycyl-tRNA synthetase beta chain